MGYGWMVGLGNALQTFGQKQLPDMMDRMRTDRLDKQKAEQDALDYAIRKDLAHLQHDELDFRKQDAQATHAYQDRALQQNGDEMFMRNGLPMLVGRPGAVTPDVQARMGKLGMGSLIGADGTIPYSPAQMLEQDAVRSGMQRDKAAIIAANAQAKNAGVDNRLNDARAALIERELNAPPPDPSLKAITDAIASGLPGSQLKSAKDLYNERERARYETWFMTLPPDQAAAQRARYKPYLDSLGSAAAPKGSAGAATPVGSPADAAKLVLKDFTGR